MQALFQLPVDEASALLKTAKDVLDSWYTTYMQVRASAKHAIGKEKESGQGGGCRVLYDAENNDTTA